MTSYTSLKSRSWSSSTRRNDRRALLQKTPGKALQKGPVYDKSTWDGVFIEELFPSNSYYVRTYWAAHKDANLHCLGCHETSVVKLQEILHISTSPTSRETTTSFLSTSWWWWRGDATGFVSNKAIHVTPRTNKIMTVTVIQEARHSSSSSSERT